jgi:rhamnogalacturonyl hydrolase YesR
LWYRDGNWFYPAKKTANGSPVFWSGCNAWAVAGQARVLQYMPATYKDRGYHVQQFTDLCEAIRKAPALGTDGLWRTSLFDYNQFPEKESIASAFFAFAFCWGINNGILDKATYEPLVRKTWSALVANIASDGSLEWCQTGNDQPDHIQQAFSAAEGEGAFMLLGEELTRLVTGTAVAPATRNGRAVYLDRCKSSSAFDLCGRRIQPKPGYAHAYVWVTAGRKNLQTGIGRTGIR